MLWVFASLWAGFLDWVARRAMVRDFLAGMPAACVSGGVTPVLTKYWARTLFHCLATGRVRQDAKSSGMISNVSGWSSLTAA